MSLNPEAESAGSTGEEVWFDPASLDQSVARRFEQVASTFPTRVALNMGDQTLSYRQLNARVNQIARAILTCEVDKDCPVAIFLPSDVDYVATLLAVLKAGHFYVPLDPEFPRSRTESILNDSTATLMVTNASLLDSVQSLSSRSLSMLVLEQVDTAIDSSNLGLEISPIAPATLIYTSGSSGDPKGVLQNQRNVLANCRRQTQAFAITAKDRLPFCYSPGVMGAVRVLYNTLLNGAELVLVDIKTRGIGPLRDCLINDRLTVYHSVPSVFRSLVGALGHQAPGTALRLIILGGEAAQQSDFQLYRKHFPTHCLFLTGYGSTEAGTVCANPLNHQSNPPSGPLSPGRTVVGVDVFTVDEHGRALPPEAEGELAIRSDSIALGYWRRPELTRKSFMGPTSDDPSRWYLSGDIGSIDADKQVTISGRVDFQVKIRGHKVALVAVETALQGVDQVTEAAVVTTVGPNHEVTLLAYMTVRDTKHPPMLKSLRQGIELSLPQYMIPGKFFLLDSMPRTPSGKIDRHALAKTHCREIHGGNRFVDPITVAQQQMAAIWRDVLQLERVGITDSFFDIGGDSLKAVDLILRMVDCFGKEPSLTTLTQYSTIEQLVEWVGGECEDVDHRIVRLKSASAPGQPPLFAFTGRGGSVLSYIMLANRIEQDRDVIGLQLPGVVEGEEPLDRVEPLALELLQRMRSVQAQGPYHMLGYSFGGLVAYEIACLLKRQGESVDYLAMIDSRRPAGGRIRHLAGRIFQYLNQWQPWKGGHWREGLSRVRTRLDKWVSTGQVEAKLSPVELRMVRISSASQRAAARYRARRYHGSLFLLKCNEGSDARPFGIGDSPCYGWDSVVIGPIHKIDIQGQHLGLFGHANIKNLAAAVNRSLEQSESASEPNIPRGRSTS